MYDVSTYCISDIHGHWANLERFLSILHDDDQVFVLGDVVDKGDDSIRVLQYVMNDERFTMIMGNHEHMMWQYLATNSVTDYYQWIVMNHGMDTYAQFAALLQPQRKEIYEYLENLPLNIPDLTVGERKFYLVHSLPVSSNQVTMKDLDFDADAIADYVWSRYEYQKMYDDMTVIAGHTPVLLFGISGQPFYSGTTLRESDYINIDGGLAGSLPGSVLIALKLDDMTFETY